MSTDIQGLLKSLGEQLERLGVEHGIADNAAVVVLPGKKKLKTVVGLIPAPDSLRVEAFVCRAVEENHEAVYKWLLQRNRRLFGIGYTIDAAGDIYLVGQLPAQLADDDLDRLLGQLLETADGDFNQILERGFASAIKREWEWRVDRGENLANLEQFRHMVE
ncbi:MULTISPECIES: YbjN domain-containing protein [Corynebacterium]|uniref:YbjN domain-containing protein n=1 Tax=Corynebacterium amycolatum TaxID=43765 RepID=A0AAW9SXB6_CORAY|nr:MULTISPECIES: YbjN domain-containing protein [Corynebacterium]MDK7110514.1 YbjN domain-containing protein [Corynebacterium amycolatum]MDK7237898.1 YbjN domain-containing protein [Corynebacterium amycolatum]MDK7247862.1 YbjN domain-containing protein [Corynebacterium amycolatum]MDY7341100.1 YbjN domain-containing protein [Corynebacterium amycolatum]TXS70880.1 YbjN domain-containing protein [Corynebacterium sp. LK11]